MGCAILLSVVTVSAATQTCNKPGQKLDGVTAECVAAVDGFGYSDFDDAWSKVRTDGGTLTLYKEATVARVRTLGKNITIDLNEKKLNVNAVLTVDAKNTLTIKNGELNTTVNDVLTTVANANLVLDNVDVTMSGTLVKNVGTATITGGELVSTASSNAVFYNEGTLSVTGATVKAESLTADVVKNLGTVTLTNNTVTAKSALLLEVAAHESVSNLVSGTYNVNHVVNVSMTNGASTDKKDPAVVTITDGTYNSEKQAIEVAKGVTLKVNGGTITANDTTAVVIKDADVTLVGGTITAKHGYVIDTKSVSDTGTPNGSLTITGGKYVSADREGNDLHVTVSTYTISKNVTILANNNSVTFDKAITVDDKGSLTITGANLTISYTLVVNKGGNLALNNVTFTTTGTLVENSGTTVVTGGTFTSTAANSLFKNKGNLTLNNVKVTGTHGSTMINVLSHNSNTVINGGTYDVSALFALPNVKPVETGSNAETPANVTVKVDKAFVSVGTVIRNKAIVTFEGGAFNVATGNALELTEGTLNITGGEVVATKGDAIKVSGNAKATLNVTAGTVIAEDDKVGYALSLVNPNATYSISGGTFSTNPKGETNKAAMYVTEATKNKDGNVELAKAFKGILTGGKYLNNIIAKVNIAGIYYDVTNQLVAKDYTVKTEDPYKVVVSTKADDDKKPAAKPEEQAPNTYDAGLVYMGLALSKYGNITISSYC